MGSHWLRHLCARGVCPPNPSTVTFGTLLALAATGSAILFHLTKLGIALKPVGDHGELFALAVLYWARFVRWRYFCCTANCRWSAGASGQRDRITETPEFSTRTMSCWSSSNSSRYRKMPTDAGAPPLEEANQQSGNNGRGRHFFPPDACRSQRPCAWVADWRRNATGRGSRRSAEIATIFTVNVRLGSQHTLGCRLSSGRRDFGSFRMGNWNQRLRYLAPVYFSQGSESHFTVNLCELIDGVR